MENVFDEVSQRTQLAFSNQMEMLTFHLTDGQQYGINVFKIIEVLETPGRITQIPQSHPTVIGAIDFRNRAIPIIDLAAALEMTPVDRAAGVSYIIVCEYSNTVVGFLISSPNKLMTKNWNDIKAPGDSLANSGYLTALTYDDEFSIQILDIEKILIEIIGMDEQIGDAVLQSSRALALGGFRVLAVDDSRAARAMLEGTLSQLGTPHVIVESAHKAWEQLTQAGSEGFQLIISDIEMPGMDGFTFTRQVKSDARFATIPLILHSSLSNASNRDKAEQVGANGFIAKYQPDSIANLIMSQAGH